MRQRVGEQALHVRYIVEEDAVIDRVVGLAGDRVVWDEGRLSINGSVVSWDYSCSRSVYRMTWT